MDRPEIVDKFVREMTDRLYVPGNPQQEIVRYILALESSVMRLENPWIDVPEEPTDKEARYICAHIDKGFARESNPVSYDLAIQWIRGQLGPYNGKPYAWRKSIPLPPIPPLQEKKSNE